MIMHSANKRSINAFLLAYSINPINYKVFPLSYIHFLIFESFPERIFSTANKIIFKKKKNKIIHKAHTQDYYLPFKMKRRSFCKLSSYNYRRAEKKNNERENNGKTKEKKGRKIENYDWKREGGK